MKILFLPIVFLFSLSAQAEMLKMAVITSEFDKNVMDFYLITNDQNNIDSLRYVTTTPNGGIEEDVTLPAETVMNEGAVLVVRNGFDAVKLELENFNVVAGGTVKLNYLYNGVTGVRNIKRLNLKKENDLFQLQDQGNHLNRMYLVANWLRFFGIVGIREIQTSFQN